MSDPERRNRADTQDQAGARDRSRSESRRVDQIGEQSLVDITVEESKISASDVAGHHLDIDARGWIETDPADAPDISLRVDEIIAGRATELRFEPESPAFSVLDGSNTAEIPARFDEGALQRLGQEFHLTGEASTELPDGSYRFRTTGTLTGFIQVDSALTISWEPDTERLVLTFPHPTTVTLGFRSGIELPRETITITPTPEGLATALSYLSSGLRTMDPERSFPTMRGHPPAIELGEETTVPDDVREQSHETGIEFVVPPTFEALLPIAPLAYFLGADVRVAEGSPVLRIPDQNYERSLPDPPDLQYRAAQLLRHVFFLDCLVRNAGDWGTDIMELDALEASDVNLDIEACYAQSSADRLTTYLALDPDVIDDVVPAWRHWTYVDPTDTEEVLPSLPTMLFDMSLVFTPDARDAPERAAATGETDLRPHESVVGNLGANVGTGDQEFPASLAGYRNRLAHVAQTDERTNVTVVATDPDAERTSKWLEAHYRQRLGADGTVERRMVESQSQLSDIFAAPADLLHVVGECTSEGLVCPDGTLAPESLVENAARLFVLDLPGDTDEATASQVAERLVDAGSVSGLIIADETTPSMPPPESLEPGTDARDVTASIPFVGSGLLTYGLSTQMACQLVRYLSESARITAVGDGTYRMHSRGIPSFIFEPSLDTSADFRVYIHQLFAGVGAVSAFVGHQPRLSGTPFHLNLDARWVGKNVLSEDAVIYDGELYWPGEAKRLFYPLA